MKRLDQYWQTRNPLAWALWPLSGLFCAAAGLRAAGYAHGLLRVSRCAAPVIVVGNISVGGTGKTPLVVWLARYLAHRGYRPGILTRGYTGSAREWPQPVCADSDPFLLGDEAVLLARRAGCPVMAGPKRVASAARLIDEFGCNLLISDDGLQHYAMGRDIEIAVIDGERRFGNGFCLPAGPLRERVGRLRRVDLQIVNGAAQSGESSMRMQADYAVRLTDPSERRPLADFIGEQLIALAGIGNPSRFFSMLRAKGLTVQAHEFADHHRFTRSDLRPFAEDLLLMTEKDAVKCAAFGGENHWYAPIDAVPDAAFTDRLNQLLEGFHDDGQ